MVKWAQYGVRANCASLSYDDTAISGDYPFGMTEEWYNLTPMRRQADERELKGSYLYLASDAGPYPTGAVVVEDGGYICR